MILARNGIRLFLASLLFATYVCVSQSTPQPGIQVKARLEPADLFDSNPSQLYAEIQSTQPISNLHLELSAPPGFKVTPASMVDLPSFQGKYTVPVTLTREGNKVPVGQRTVTVRVLSGTAPAISSVAEASVSFNYLARLSICAYLVLGGLGVLIGYALRLAINALKAIPAPALAPVPGGDGAGAGAPALGPLTAFIKRHYYLVDCGVTLVVGVLALTLLIKDNHVPDSGLYWYSALGAGVALGLLTNSDLFSKLR